MARKEKKCEKSPAELSERSSGILKAIIKGTHRHGKPGKFQGRGRTLPHRTQFREYKDRHGRPRGKGLPQAPPPLGRHNPDRKSFRLYVNTLSELEEPVESIKHIIRKSLRSGPEGLFEGRDADAFLRNELRRLYTGAKTRRTSDKGRALRFSGRVERASCNKRRIRGT